MTFEELNEEVREHISGPDWYLYKGAVYPRDCGFASDKFIFVRQEDAVKEMFTWLEELEVDKSRREKDADPERDWDIMVSTYAANTLNPVGLMDYRDKDDFLFDWLVLLRNEDRKKNVFLHGGRYRILVDTVDIEGMRGKEPADPVVATAERDGDEHPTGIIAPITDRSGKYTEVARERFGSAVF